MEIFYAYFYSYLFNLFLFFIMKIFQNAEINVGRQVFLDVAKTIAIFGMILAHVATKFQMRHRIN